MGVHPPVSGLSLCAGAGGLDLGLMLAEPGFHTSCFVENDPDAQEALVAAMLGECMPGNEGHEASIDHMGLATAPFSRFSTGYFVPAPVWGDVRTFVGDAWRGHIDIILAGYPCQPFSAAGKRGGADDERHLWPDVARIISEVRPLWCFLENVAGHLSLGLETVLRDLWRLGYSVAVGAFSSSETGATHDRLRVFIVADNQDHIRELHARSRTEGGGAPDTERRRGGSLADASGGQLPQPGRGSQGRDGAGSAGAQRGMVNTQKQRRGEGPAEPIIRGGRDAITCAGGDMGDTSGAGWEGSEQRGSYLVGAGPRSHGSVGEPGGAWLPLSPPGPGDRTGWSHILSRRPDLAPALSLDHVALAAGGAEQAVEVIRQGAAEPDFRRVVDGLASRSRALKLLGNGVHPLVAAYAWRSLSYALGLWPVDLGAEGGVDGGAG